MPGNVTVEIRSESGQAPGPARILIHSDKELIAEVTAEAVPKRCTDHESRFCVKLTTQSELQRLLEKNAGKEELTTEEYDRASSLIVYPVLSGEDCRICKAQTASGITMQVNKAILGTQLCPGHARYVLLARK